MLNNYRQTFYAPFTCKTVYQRMKYVYSNESDLNFIGGKLLLCFYNPTHKALYRIPKKLVKTSPSIPELKKDGNLHGFQKSIVLAFLFFSTPLNVMLRNFSDKYKTDRHTIILHQIMT